VASFVYNEGASLLTAGTINWASDTIKARLVASSFTPDRDNTVMTGHTGIGTDQTLGTKTKTKDTTNDRIVYDAADPTWTAVAGGSTVGSVDIYKFGTNDADSVPICNIDVTDLPTNGSDIVLPLAAAGIFYLQE
jgi:hypothetical protein